MREQPQIEVDDPRRLGFLPLVMDVYRRSGLPKILVDTIPTDPRSKVDIGKAVGVMLCAVFAGAQGLWRIRERLDGFDMPTIMREQDFNLESFPEERLAKALDDLYRCGLDRLMTGVALETIRQFRLDTSWLHFDTTSLSFFGAYEGDDPFAGLDGVAMPPKVTYGHSKAHRPDLKQLLFGALVSRDGGIPLYTQVLDGNASDSAVAASFFSRVRELVEDPAQVCCVADSKGWCASVLTVVQHEGLRLLSRLPRHHRLHREVMAMPVGRMRTMTLAPRSGKGPDRYDFVGFDVEEVLTLPAGPDQPARVIRVPARAVRVRSTALLRTKLKSLERLRTRERAAAMRRMREWQDMVYACAEDAERAAGRHVGQADFDTLGFTSTVTRHDGPAKRGRGRPRRRPEPALAAVRHWRVRYGIDEVPDHQIQERLLQRSTFVLIRTRNPGWVITDEEMIRSYKCQCTIEHGFSWLKHEAAINPMFLHTPHRMAALCFVHTLGLMIWNLIERTVRKNLRDAGTGLPYYRRKRSDRITTRFYFELFGKPATARLRVPGQRDRRVLMGMEPVTHEAVEALGSTVDIFHPL